MSQAGVARALDLLRQAARPAGFVASPRAHRNYDGTWARDGVITGLAALLTDDAALIETFRRGLLTLCDNQGPHGEIPSNVAAQNGRASYGTSAGRIDADLWFVIGCGEYWKATHDDEFLTRVRAALARVQFLLGAWEMNNRGLLYVPQTGDWADQYIHHGYVLYDQALYYQAQRTLAGLHRDQHSRPDEALEERVQRLRQLIRTNYWFDGAAQTELDPYDHSVYEQGRQAAHQNAGRYWLPSFAPYGYEHRFDAFANVLVSLFDISDDHQRADVDEFVAEHAAPGEMPLLRAFCPVITPGDRDWPRLQAAVRGPFRNEPYKYQNGGLWPMITGFYVADLARRGEQARAARHLEAIHGANRMPADEETQPDAAPPTEWGFSEYLSGDALRPGGTSPQTWSAAGALLGHYALQGRAVFRY